MKYLKSQVRVTMDLDIYVPRSKYDVHGKELIEAEVEKLNLPYDYDLDILTVNKGNTLEEGELTATRRVGGRRVTDLGTSTILMVDEDAEQPAGLPKSYTELERERDALKAEVERLREVRQVAAECLPYLRIGRATPQTVHPLDSLLPRLMKLVWSTKETGDE